MSTASDVANLERWLHDAQVALEWGKENAATLKERAAEAKAQIPVLKEAVADAEVALKNARDNLEDESVPDGPTTEAHAGAAEGEGTVN
jgi:hypothetical protein